MCSLLKNLPKAAHLLYDAFSGKPHESCSVAELSATGKRTMSLGKDLHSACLRRGMISPHPYTPPMKIVQALSGELHRVGSLYRGKCGVPSPRLPRPTQAVSVSQALLCIYKEVYTPPCNIPRMCQRHACLHPSDFYQMCMQLSLLKPTFSVHREQSTKLQTNYPML